MQPGWLGDRKQVRVLVEQRRTERDFGLFPGWPRPGQPLSAAQPLFGPGARLIEEHFARREPRAPLRLARAPPRHQVCEHRASLGARVDLLPVHVPTVLRHAKRDVLEVATARIRAASRTASNDDDDAGLRPMIRRCQ